MARVNFPFPTYLEPSGVLANGHITIEISEDVQSPTGQICRGATLAVPLDSSGTVTSVPQVWPNASLAPSGSYYTLRAYTAEGELVLGPAKVTV